MHIAFWPFFWQLFGNFWPFFWGIFGVTVRTAKAVPNLDGECLVVEHVQARLIHTYAFAASPPKFADALDFGGFCGSDKRRE